MINYNVLHPSKNLYIARANTSPFTIVKIELGRATKTQFGKYKVADDNIILHVPVASFYEKDKHNQLSPLIKNITLFFKQKPNDQFIWNIPEPNKKDDFIKSKLNFFLTLNNIVWFTDVGKLHTAKSYVQSFLIFNDLMCRMHGFQNFSQIMNGQSISPDFTVKLSPQYKSDYIQAIKNTPATLKY